MAPSLSRVFVGLASLVVLGGVALGLAVENAVLAGGAAAAAIAVVAGWFLVHHEPHLSVGPALAWSSACVVLVRINDVLAASEASGDPLPFSGAARHWWAGCWPVNLAGVFALLLVFPAGASRGRLSKGLPWLYAGATTTTVIALWDVQQAGGHVVSDISRAREVAAFAGLVVIGLCLASAFASGVSRYRAGDGHLRRQMRWLLATGGSVVLLLAAGWGTQLAGWPLEASYTPFLAAIVLLVPVAVTIAVVRHDLFDIDRLLSTSVTWLLTLLASSAVFALVVTMAGQLVHSATAIESTVAAFVTALAFLPLQRSLNSLVGRVVDRDRFAAVDRVERFATEVRHGRQEPEHIERVLQEAQGDDQLVVLLAAPGGGWIRLDGSPASLPAGAATFDLQAGGDTISRIVLGWDSRRARSRIADLARPAFMPIEVSRLRMALRDALHESQASRLQLVSATADERRRLERELHDGAQQRIIATGMRVRSLQARIAPEHAPEVDRVVDELLATVQELRRLARGLRPGRLGDGLEAALSEFKETSPIPLDVRIGELPALEESRLLTIYLMIAEAITNALKHAQASRIAVEVSAHEGDVRVVVSDDGVGLPPGARLSALRDRALSGGGTLDVVSRPGHGTTITAML